MGIFGKKKQVCMKCGRRRRPAVVAPFGGGTLVLCEPCRDELRDETAAVAESLGVELELAEQ
jgi:hypothetical protein